MTQEAATERLQAASAAFALYCVLLWTLLAFAPPAQAQRQLGSRGFGDLRIVGHEPDIDPALRRFTGIVVALGHPDASGHVHAFRMAPIGPRAVDPLPDELRGWRLTVLSGKRFASVFRVQSNTATEITVKAAEGNLEQALEGLAADDVFVIEEIDEPAPGSTMHRPDPAFRPG